MNKISCLWLVLLFLNSCVPVAENKTEAILNATLITKKQEYIAGQKIILKYRISGENIPMLLVENAYGTSLIQGRKEHNEVVYIFPSNYSNRVGKCSFKLIGNKEKLDAGDIYIHPAVTKTRNIETYMGPPSIIAGGKDYTMLVNVPLDTYDNPLADSTAVTINQQFNSAITTTEVKLKNFIGWKNIYAPEKSGRILVSALCNALASKELNAIVFPANATDFKIDYERVHKYADGNQVVSLKTSIIYDEYKNVVSDGTLVNFIIENKEGTKLYASGTTISGIATAKMLHPVVADRWNVTAYITGAAKSNPLLVNFESAVENYKISHSKDFRTITVGPIKSFMKQLVPDGIIISCAIYNQNNKLLETKTTTSRKGIGTFYLDTDFYSKGAYQIKIKSMGLLKETNIILHE